MWSSIEINVAIICASVPALKALAVKAFPRFLLSSFSRSKQSHSNSNSGNSSRPTHPRTHGNQDITVRKSFELTSRPAEDEMRRDDIGGDRSENGLVTALVYAGRPKAGPGDMV